MDEKAQLNYIGRSLSTFALELSLMKDGSEREGWFFDTSKLTEVYAFVFDIRTTADREDALRSASFMSATIILVNRLRLQRTLVHAGLDQTGLMDIAKTLRASRERAIAVPFPGIHVVLSTKLAEEPINLLVARSHLEEIGQVLRPCHDIDV